MGYDGHPNFMNEILSSEDVDYFIFFDIDCIPLQSNFINVILERIYNKDTFIGIEQRTSHLNNDVYAGPACLSISKKFYEKLNYPKMNATNRGDVAEELSHICRERGYEINFFKFKSCVEPRWSLRNGVKFGVGSNYEDLVFHNFLSACGYAKDIFINESKKILGYEN